MNRFFKTLSTFSICVAAAIFLYSCSSSSGNMGMSQPPQALPVITLNNFQATTFQEFSTSLEGSQNIEIRPQVEGYLDRIYVDEGAYVKKGQILFAINERTYREQVNNAKASLNAARANLVNAEINVSKLTPLVKENIVSDVQLRAAKSLYDVAQANVAQAQAMLHNAEINLGYTQVKAPVEGYVGRIPFRTGSLVGMGTVEPLTVISAVSDIRAYFSFSEKEFLQFKEQFSGNTIEEKIKQMPPVELILADNSTYPEKGKVELVSGQFDNSKGTISFRATFKNPDGLLRSGNSGRIRIPNLISSAVVVPKEATFELQDKVFVFILADSNKVISRPISVSNSSGNYYLLKGNEVKAGEKIVYTGLDRLRDGVIIQPQALSMDSLMKANPL
jgi:membrane fusion protein (multidrug efflux system)